MTTLYYWFGLDPFKPNVESPGCPVMPYHFSLRSYTKFGIICEDYVRSIECTEKFSDHDYIVVIFPRRNPEKFMVRKYPLAKDVIDVYPPGDYYCQVGSQVTKFCTIVFE